ncbi:two-component response regulator ARR11-like [Carex rostrata]
MAAAADLALEEALPAGIRVLVIDDDRISLKVVCIMLKKCGYEATQCSSGKEALEMLTQYEGEFDIVLTDVHMPDMDGFELLEKVGLGMDLPVVMLSEDSSRETVVKGINHGACDYLIKPVQIEELKKIAVHVLTWRNANSSIDSDLIED